MRILLAAALLALPRVALAQDQPLEPLPPPPNQPLPPPAQPAQPTTPTVEDFGRPAPPPVQDLGPPPAPRDETHRLKESLKGELGYEYAQVHGVPINAGRLVLGFGAQNDTQANYVIVNVMVGETREHRRAWDLRLGWNGDLYRAGILRLGLVAEAGYLVVRRVTDDSRAYAFGIGAGGHAGVDITQWGPRGDHAITLDGRFDAHLHFGNAVQWGPSILLGVRW